MKKSIFTYLFFFLLTNLANAQINLLTEDFETDGEGTRYTSNNFDDACNDFFERYSNGGGNCLTNEPTNISGTFYWAGEDVDAASGGTGIVTLNPVTVTSYNLEMKVFIAVGRPNDFRFETVDELLFQYNMDGAGWNTFAAFYGSYEGSGFINGDLTQDADFNGMGDPGGLEITSSDFVDLIFPIPVTGNSLEVRFIYGQDGGTEEIMVDNIRINSTPPLPIELSGFSLQETENGEVKIKWQTVSELNNEYFTIERSTNAVTWEEIIRLDAVGTSNNISNYNVVDGNPFPGTSYYRLKQIDFDGNYEYSKSQIIHLKKQETSRVNVYPNPSHDHLTLEGHLSEIENIIIFNSHGQDVTPKVYINDFNKDSKTIDLTNLPSGLYLLKTKTMVQIKFYKL